MTKTRSGEEGLGFVETVAAKGDEVPPPEATDEGAYEDSWYQVLRARAGETVHDDVTDPA